MSTAGDKEDDEEECFYESLDRILSSSSTSTSTSDDDGATAASSPNLHRRRHHIPFPGFPPASSGYDVWVSQPSSVQERRSRLLREMGLASAVDAAKSASADCLETRTSGGDGDIVTGRSGRVRPKSYGGRDLSRRSDQFSFSPVSRSSDKMASESVNTADAVDPQGSSQWSNKPPPGENSRRTVHDFGCRSTNSTNSNANPSLDSSSPVAANSGGGGGRSSSSRDLDELEAQVCLIKNLDNGKEFVINEVREDGRSTKLKDLQTGRQLTMEEFETCVGHSPLVQELMRRQNVENRCRDNMASVDNGGDANGGKLKKRRSWFRNIKSVSNSVTGGYKERRSSDERDTLSDRGGRRSSSATDDSQDVSFQWPERVRVRQYGKSCRELSAVYKNQEIQAHKGSIWSIKFSLDGRYLASAGEDCVIHVWKVVESERKGELLMEKFDGNLNLLFVANGSPEPTSISPIVDNSHAQKKKKRGKTSSSRKSMSLEHVVVPEAVFALSETPFCSFQGHLDDVLDLSWSKSQFLLSSSMDKTVRLWHLERQSCLKVFSHNDYVTCIQFNPVDERYFISGSLDSKVRIWSIPDRLVVGWNDLREMITAASYTPDGQGALVGSNKGNCHLYNISDNKFLPKSDIITLNRKKKSNQKKITGFQFAPGRSSEVIVTSADSRIRVIKGVDLIHKFKGFRNTNSQMSASLTANGKHVICASEDSYVYVWKYDGDSRPIRSKGVPVTRSYEQFYCQDVSAAIPWPGTGDMWAVQDPSSKESAGPGNHPDEAQAVNHPPTPVEFSGDGTSQPGSQRLSSPLNSTVSSASNNYFFDRISATWPEEQLPLATKIRSPQSSFDLADMISQNRSAWPLVIVTAGLRGEIRTFQNFGFPVRV